MAWDQFVTDDALGRCIRAARRALEDDAVAPRCQHDNPWTWVSFHRAGAETASRTREDEVVTMVPIQSISLQPSAAGREGHICRPPSCLRCQKSAFAAVTVLRRPACARWGIQAGDSERGAAWLMPWR